MELISFVENKSFDEVKEMMTNGPLNLSIKEHGDLYMISFTKKSDITNKLVRDASGIILEKNTNKVIHHSFAKAYEGINTLEEDTFRCEDIEKLNYTLEFFTEGSIIRVYYYEDSWNVGTSRNINAALSFWGSEKSFKELFYEALRIDNINLDDLDKEYCYSFILQHPEIKIGLDIAVPYCSMINMVNLKTLEETRTTEGYRFDKTYTDIQNEHISIDKNYMMFLENGVRVKLMNNNYKRSQQLLNNNPNIKWTYLECIKNNTHRELRERFKNEKNTFDMIDEKFDEAVDIIHICYMERYIRKKDTDVYFKHEKSLKQLHWFYRKTKKPVTISVVEDLLFDLNIKTLYWLLNL